MAELDDMIARLRGLGRAAKAAVPAIAKECKDIIAQNIANQCGPDGVPWPRPADPAESLVLRNAAAAVSAQAVNGAVLLTLNGPEARHHLGIARGKVQRKILPTKGIPAPMAEAIRRVLFKKLDEAAK